MTAALRDLAVLAAACVVSIVVVLDEARERDARRADSELLAVVVAQAAALAAALDLALSDHEAAALDTAAAYRTRCEWWMVPRAIRREFATALALSSDRGAPVVVSLVDGP